MDQDALDELEDILIMADIGPTTAAKLVEDFSQERFDKEITPLEIRKALAGQMAERVRASRATLRYYNGGQETFRHACLRCEWCG